MKPWIRVYSGRCKEIRFGALGLQAGITLPTFTCSLWRNSDYKQIASYRWGTCLA